ANAILMAHSSTVELVKLVGSAQAAVLSNSGEAQRLARNEDDIERDIETKATAKRLGVQVGILRKAVADERRRRRPVATEDAPAGEYDEDPPWAGKIDLNYALTTAAERVTVVPITGACCFRSQHLLAASGRRVFARLTNI